MIGGGVRKKMWKVSIGGHCDASKIKRRKESNYNFF